MFGKVCQQAPLFTFTPMATEHIDHTSVRWKTHWFEAGELIRGSEYPFSMIVLLDAAMEVHSR